MEKATGKWPQDYLPIDPPEQAEFVWDVFWEMRGSAKGGFGGAEPLGFGDIDAWERVRDFRLGNFVANMLLAMDKAYLREWHKEGRSFRKGASGKPK